MEPQTTRGMTVVGIANVALGSLGLALLMSIPATAELIVIANLFLTRSARSSSPLSIDMGDVHIATGDSTWMLAGAVAVVVLLAALDVLLLVAGVRVLARSPRGRTNSLTWAGLALCAGAVDVALIVDHWNGLSFVMLPIACLTPAYAILLIVLFRRPAWRRAFAS